MARVLCRTILAHSIATVKPSPVSALVGRRHRSSEASDKPIFIEIDLESSSSSNSRVSTNDNEVARTAINRLDDIVKHSLVNQIKPDWLPFRPGSSFWVPPIPTVAHVLPLMDPEKLEPLNLLTEAENLPVANLRGLPCPTMLLPDDDEESDENAIILEFKGLQDAEIEVKVVRNPNASQFDDDES